MSQQFLVSYGTWPSADPIENSISNHISRINCQKGHFRNVTEQSLEAEIQLLEAGQTSMEVDGIEPEDQLEPPANSDEKTKTIYEAREDIIKQITQAHMEAYYALDFVSLLLSKDTPIQAGMTLSPHLKQYIPLGSLATDQIPSAIRTPAHKRDQELVSRGWKLQGLVSSADSLLRSASRLEAEIHNETTYWDQVLEIKNSGWPICRMPGAPHTLCVKYGFSEASPAYRGRDLAPLRRGEDGAVFLDQNDFKPKSIRVRVLQGDSVLATSKAASTYTDVLSIQDRILIARNTIFEEELFFELLRESRLLLSHGVTIIDSVITYKTPLDIIGQNLGKLGSQRIVIDLIAIESETFYPQEDGSANIAEYIALILRILLSHAHRKTLQRRSKPPPPLTDRKIPIPFQALFGPIIAFLMHDSALRSLTAFNHRLTTALQSAGLNLNVSTNPYNNLLTAFQSNSAKRRGRKSIANAFIATMISPLSSSMTIHLPSGVSQKISILTSLYSPTFGTTYSVSSTGEGPTTPDVSVESEPSIFNFLVHLHTETVRLFTVSESLRNSESSLDSGASGWGSIARSGELQKDFPSLGRSKRMKVSLHDGPGGLKIGLRWGWMGGKAGGDGEGSYEWGSGSFNSDAPKKSLRDVITEAGKL
ncbi:MAG: RNA polymerase II mediator complex subunit [Trizodia sp. TS-e1964]|nr:MAG: RNA polymerase II mediator complex subunit [Trizodia sp. TS-e1964]